MLFLVDSILIAVSCAADAFAVSFAYGTKKIQIPLISCLIISSICTAVLGASMVAGTVLLQIIPPIAATWLAFSILMISGLLKLSDSIMKKVTRHYFAQRTPNGFFAKLISMYVNPEEADCDKSSDISSGESAGLAVALSLDGIAIGIGASLGGANVIAVVIAAFVANAVFMMFGSLLGKLLVRRISWDISWLGGVILIGLAISLIV